MEITSEWLQVNTENSDWRHDAMEWFEKQSERDGVKIVIKLIAENRLKWANCLIVRIMSRNQYVNYAVYAAEQVVEIYEKISPDDKRPRMAIEVAKKWNEKSTSEIKAVIKEAESASEEAWDADGDILYDELPAAAVACAASAAANAARVAYLASADAAEIKEEKVWFAVEQAVGAAVEAVIEEKAKVLGEEDAIPMHPGSNGRWMYADDMAKKILNYGLVLLTR